MIRVAFWNAFDLGDAQGKIKKDLTQSILTYSPKNLSQLKHKLIHYKWLERNRFSTQTDQSGLPESLVWIPLKLNAIKFNETLQRKPICMMHLCPLCLLTLLFALFFVIHYGVGISACVFLFYYVVALAAVLNLCRVCCEGLMSLCPLKARSAHTVFKERKIDAVLQMGDRKSVV